MQNILEDPEKLGQKIKPHPTKQHWKKLICLLLLLGLTGTGLNLGPKGYEWMKNYQCAQKELGEKHPEEAFQCLERFSPKAAHLFIQLGIDLRKFYLSVINQWFDRRQFQKALEVSETAWHRFPWEPAFLGDQASALFYLGRFKEAVDHLEAFLKLPQIEILKKANGVRFYLVAAQIYLGAQNINQSEHYLEKALATEPDNASAHLLYARLESFRENSKAMLMHYEKVKAQDPKQLVWQDLFLMAIQYLNSNQTEKFEKMFAESRRTFPNASGFHLLLALQYLKEGNYASAYYEILFEKEVGLADAAYFKEAIREIEKKFQTAFQNRPAETWLFPLYQFIHGQQAYEEKDYPRALAWMEQSLRQEEHPLQSLYLGRALAGMGQTDKAIEHYGKALSKQETFALATAELAGLYLQKGVRETAQTLWAKALSMDPQIAHLSQIGVKLAEQQKGGAIVPSSISEAYVAKLADSLMQLQLNQTILKSFVHAFQLGVQN